MDLVINLYKARGITSQTATSEVKSILKARKAGHTGTLDPDAAGILLICTNRATRVASYFAALDKEYNAVMKLGEATDTQDAQGNVIRRSVCTDVTRPEIENALESFRGEISQTPPMYSALKFKGKPLYKYAKKGIDVPRSARTVSIHSIEPLDISIPFVSFRVRCSKGTYVRTLCHDIGGKLGTGAHLVELERTAVGPFKLDTAIRAKELRENPAGRKGILSVDRALSWMPELVVVRSLVKHVRNGVPLTKKESPDLSKIGMPADSIKVKSPDGEFLAIGRLGKNRDVLKMEVVFGT